MADKKLSVIGSTSEVDFLDYSIFDVPSKVDTGADRSSVWVSELEESNKVLTFKLFDQEHPSYTGRPIEIKDYNTTIVKNSSGHREHRYRVLLKIRLEEKVIKTHFTLTDRSHSLYPVLIGRKTLANKFVVDVSQNKPNYSYAKSMNKMLTSLNDEDTSERPRLRVGVLSREANGYSTKRIMHALRIRGHEAIVVNHAECYVDIEQDNPDVRYRGEDISGLDAVVPRIGSSITRYGSAIVRQFEMMGVYTTARSIAIERSRNKLRSLQLLSKAGVGIPKTIFSRETDAVDDLIEQIGTPMIIKVAQGTHGRGVVLVDSKKAAKSVIQAFYVEKVSILLQEFIKEASGEDIRAFVIGGKVVAAMQRKSLTDDFRSNIHMGGTTSEVTMTRKEKSTAAKAAKSMGLDICGVDMVRSKRGPLVLEVNSSPGLQGIEQATKLDIATEIVKFIEKNAVKKLKKDKVGA